MTDWKNFHKTLTALAVLGIPTAAWAGVNTPADFTVHSQVSAPNPPRFGFNDASGGGIEDNIWLNEGGAPKDIRYALTADTDGTATTFIDVGGGGTDIYDSVRTGYFVGATARVYRLSGGQWSLLRTDTVTGYTAVAGSTSPADHTITFASSGPATKAGDIIWLTKDAVFANIDPATVSPRLTPFYSNWNTSNTSVYTHVPDGPPGDKYGAVGSSTASCIQITDSASETAGLWNYLQYGVGTQPGFETGHTYRVSVWLKQTGIASGSATFSLGGWGVSHTFTGINNTWQQYTWDFAAPANRPTGSPQPTIRLEYTAPGTLNVDQWQLYDAANPPFTLDSRVLAAWQNFQPSTIRIWSNFSNSAGNYSFWSLDSWLADESEERETPGLGNAFSRDTPNHHLPTALKYCKQVGAQPWLIVNMSMNEQEWSNLIDYLAGPSTTTFGAKRPSDHTNPYTDDFSTIYLEVGNEEWGTQVTPWNANYGAAAHYLLSKATANPNFNASKFKFVVNGFYSIPDFGANAIAAATEASVVDFFTYSDTSAISPAPSGDAYYQDGLLQLPIKYQSTIDQEVATQAASAAAGHPYTIAVYEGGPGGDDPNYSATADTSLEAAVTALDIGLYGALKGVGPQNFFLFNPSGQGLYSSHSNYNNGFVPHPVWEALQMRNQYCAGDMTTMDANANPTTTITGTNVNGTYPLIGAYTFHDTSSGNKADIVVVSRDLNNSTPVTLHLPAAPTGTGTLYKLTGDPRANNDTGFNIPITSQALSGITRDYTFTMPAGSVYIFQIPTAAWPAAGPINLKGTSDVGQVKLTWNAFSGATSYNLYRSTSPGGEGYTAFVTNIASPSYTDNSVTNGTAYYYRVTAVTSGSETDRSNEAAITPSATVTVAWDFNGNVGNEASVAPTSVTRTVTAGSISRGSGLLPEPIGYTTYQDVSGTFSFYPNGDTFGTTLAGSETKSDYTQFTLSPTSGYTISLSTLNLASFFMGGSTLNAALEYSTNGTSFTSVALSPGNSGSSSSPVSSTVSLSSIAALQNIASGTTVTLRLYFYDSAGNYYARGGIGPITGNDLSLTAVVSGNTPPPPTPVTLAAWDFNGKTGHETSDTATTVASNVTVGAISRGSGLLPEPNGYTNYQDIAGTFSFYPNNNLFGSTLAGSVTNSDYVTTTLTPTSGHNLSLSSLNLATFYYAGSTLNAALEYSTNGTSFTPVALSPGNSGSSSSPVSSTVDLSSITALQNLTGTVTLRLYFYDTSSTAYYRGGIGPVSGNDLCVKGTVQ